MVARIPIPATIFSPAKSVLAEIRCAKEIAPLNEERGFELSIQFT